MIIPQKDGKIFRLNINAFTLRSMALILGGLLIMTLAMLIDYYYINSAFEQQKELDRDIKLQQFTIQKIHNQLKGIRNQLLRYAEFDRKLRIIGGLQDIGPESTQAANQRATKELEQSNILHSLENLTRDIKLREVSFFQLEGYLKSEKDRLVRTPSVAPTNGHLSSHFGRRTDPFTGKQKMHRGVDWSNGPYTPIYAPANGVVVAAYYNAGYGQFLVIDHGYDIVSRYAHLSKYEVKVGQKVKRGHLIARMGNTGRSTATHLHYEVLVRDQHVDPEQFILE